MTAAAVQTYAGSAVAVLALALSLIHSRPEGALPRLEPIARTRAAEFYVSAAGTEVESREAAAKRFRGSLWSQDDEVHSHEAQFLRGQAKARKTTVATLVDTLDHAMREQWSTDPYPPPSQKVLPCRPRLNY